MNNNKPSILIGLIGSGIGKSLTPPMHEHEGDKQGMRYLYRIIDLDQLKLGVSDLSDLLLAAERMGFTGLNITHPCKQAVVEYLDELSDVAAKVGAVNTVVFSGGRRFGHNTDALGFFESFQEEIANTCPHENILLLGAGGAGTAVAHALLSGTSCNLEIFDINEARARVVVDHIAKVYGPGRAAVSKSVIDSLARADGLINATPIGMRHTPGCPLDPALLRPDLWVTDIVYVPMETELIAAATKVGCKVMRGGGMAVYQAVRAFEIFTGIRPDADRMKAHFKTLLQAPVPAARTSTEMIG